MKPSTQLALLALALSASAEVNNGTHGILRLPLKRTPGHGSGDVKVMGNASLGKRHLIADVGADVGVDVDVGADVSVGVGADVSAGLSTVKSALGNCHHQFQSCNSAILAISVEADVNVQAKALAELIVVLKASVASIKAAAHLSVADYLSLSAMIGELKGSCGSMMGSLVAKKAMISGADCCSTVGDKVVDIKAEIQLLVEALVAISADADISFDMGSFSIDASVDVKAFAAVIAELGANVEIGIGAFGEGKCINKGKGGNNVHMGGDETTTAGSGYETGHMTGAYPAATGTGSPVGNNGPTGAGWGSGYETATWTGAYPTATGTGSAVGNNGPTGAGSWPTSAVSGTEAVWTATPSSGAGGNYGSGSGSGSWSGSNSGSGSWSGSNSGSGSWTGPSSWAGSYPVTSMGPSGYPVTLGWASQAPTATGSSTFAVVTGAAGSYATGASNSTAAYPTKSIVTAGSSMVQISSVLLGAAAIVALVL
ncbi:hypothetical protein F5Y15DRAFT_128979 [Xylariaceae sp. FL0016]|nr:hypothetical protein F5Y15DRAFT_128979 [Xylariaceae sp. FL0016]